MIRNFLRLSGSIPCPGLKSEGLFQLFLDSSHPFSRHEDPDGAVERVMAVAEKMTVASLRCR